MLKLLIQGVGRFFVSLACDDLYQHTEHHGTEEHIMHVLEALEALSTR